MVMGKRMAKGIGFLLSIALLICVSGAVIAQAATGQCGKNLTYTDYYNPYSTIQVKTVISGTGPMYNYNVEDPGFYLAENISPFMENVAEVVIEEGATNIGRGAFCYRFSLKTITIPKSVTAIEYGAFYSSDRLQDVYYGGSEADWAKITIGTRNDPLKNATIHYNSDVPSGETGNTEKGQCGESVNWKLEKDTGLLTISGTLARQRRAEGRSGRRRHFHRYAGILQMRCTDGY